jgi:gamma-D-glutamyl-L-lysine dipeptidyl-peptidase
MYGIAKLSIIPGRAEPSDKAEISTQVLFGEHYEVFEEQEKWLKVKLVFDGYECWIDRKQHTPLSSADFAELQINQAPRAVDMLGIAKDLKTDTYYNLPMGSRLPFYDNGRFSVAGAEFNFKGTLAIQSRDHLVGYAMNYLNAPYLWGGRTPFGIDCSGFTQMVYALVGVPILRDAYQQAQQGSEVGFIELKEGDLAFFANPEGRITHVGLVLEGRRIIHASGKVRIDDLSAQGIVNSETGQLTHKLAHCRRF